MRVVEVGQYFVNKDTGDFRQFRSVACREYTLPRDDQASQPKGWIQGNMRIGLVLEVTTSFQYFKYGIEIRIESVNQDNSHSWVRISNGTVKYVINFFSRQHRNSCRSTRRAKVSQTSTSVVAARSKAKAKPQPRDLVGTTLVWLQEEDPNEDTSIALIIREHFSTSVLFKDILGTILLILCYRTMW